MGSSSWSGSLNLFRITGSSNLSERISSILLLIIRSGYGGLSGSRGILRGIGSIGAKCYSSARGSISKFYGVSGSTGQNRLGMMKACGKAGGSSGNVIGSGMLVG